jgi:UDP-glucose 4-epimerase
MKALVTGAAGYVGSTVVSALRDDGVDVVGLDDLSRGRGSFLAGVAHVVGDAGDRDVLDAVFDRHPDIDLVVHCAARTLVAESTADPLGYYRDNVGTAIALIEAMLARGCHRLIFSSSASVYGSTPPPVVTESSPVAAASPYAATKLMVERIVTDVCAVSPLRAVSLRYFNPVGADPRLRSGRYDDDQPDALTAVLSAVAARSPFWIHGDDWPTVDGTPTRDFVHVWDVASAHVAAARRWPAGDPHQILNVGSGRATTVRQLVEAVNRHVEVPVEIRYDARRAGDTVGCRADATLAADRLGWRAEFGLDDAVRDAIRWAATRSAADRVDRPA